MLKTGICPKCSSTEVYTNADLPTRGDRAIQPGHNGRNSTNLWLNAYLCADCGFIEDYIRPDVLSDDERMQKMRENWKKV